MPVCFDRVRCQRWVVRWKMELNRDINRESVLDELNGFDKRRPSDIPPILEDYLLKVAKTGDPMFPWTKLKPLVRRKLELVMNEFNEQFPTDNLPPLPNVETFKYDNMKTKILEAVDAFQSAPFTIQRLCELITNPRQHYKRTDKFMRGLEKNILVVSTVEPKSLLHPEGNLNSSVIMNGILDNVNSTHSSLTGSDDDSNNNGGDFRAADDELPPDNFSGCFAAAPPVTSTSDAVAPSRAVDVDPKDSSPPTDDERGESDDLGSQSEDMSEDAAEPESAMDTSSDVSSDCGADGGGDVAQLEEVQTSSESSPDQPDERPVSSQTDPSPVTSTTEGCSVEPETNATPDEEEQMDKTGQIPGESADQSSQVTSSDMEQPGTCTKQEDVSMPDSRGAEVAGDFEPTEQCVHSQFEVCESGEAETDANTGVTTTNTGVTTTTVSPGNGDEVEYDEAPEVRQAEAVHKCLEIKEDVQGDNQATSSLPQVPCRSETTEEEATSSENPEDPGPDHMGGGGDEDRSGEAAAEPMDQD